MALNQLGLTTTLLYILLTIILVILVGFIILAFKDFIPNIVAGFMIHQKDKIKSGDKIKVKDIEGKVVHVNLVETRIITKKKDTVYIPNSMLTKNEVIILKK
jgi:small-conductance mechanosensitive channel